VQTRFQLHPLWTGPRNLAATLTDRADVPSTPPPTERQHRLRAAPVGLLLLGWGLGVGPLAHAVLAHGEPLLHDSGDRGWVQHTEKERSRRSAQSEPAPSSHHHAPGALEHLQLAVSAGAVSLRVAAVFLLVAVVERIAWRAPLLSRWRLPEVPGAP